MRGGHNPFTLGCAVNCKYILCGPSWPTYVYASQSLLSSAVYIPRSLTHMLLTQGGHSPGKPGKVGGFKVGQGKVGENVFLYA